MIKNNREKVKNDLVSFLTSDINDTDNEYLNIPISSLVPFPEHHFKPYEGARFEAMVHSVKENGILLSVLVRPLSGEENRGLYQILSGHNRVKAAQAAGLDEVPCKVRFGLTDAEAALIVTETNLMQRSFSELSFSEKAVSVKAHLDSIKSVGKDNFLLKEIQEYAYSDISDILEDGKTRSRDIAAKFFSMDARSISRYVRLNFLISDMMEMLEQNSLTFQAAVQIAYLTAENQNILLNFIKEHKIKKISVEASSKLRILQSDGKFTEQEVSFILIKKAANTKKYILSERIISSYFTEENSFKEIEDTIEAALKMYREKISLFS